MFKGELAASLYRVLQKKTQIQNFISQILVRLS